MSDEGERGVAEARTSLARRRADSAMTVAKGRTVGIFDSTPLCCWLGKEPDCLILLVLLLLLPEIVVEEL